MEALTASVAILGVAGILALGPRRGLLVFLAIALLYPDFMRLPVGAIELNPHRIMIALLLCLCLLTPDIRQRFRWNHLDTAVTIATVAYAATLFFTLPSDKWLQNRGGDTVDTLFVYLVVRMLVTDRAALVSMLKILGIVLVPLAMLGVAEAIWGWSPYLSLTKYSRYVSASAAYEVRYGFNRAGGPWVSSIMFGLMFASFIPLLRLLRMEAPPWRGLTYLLCGIACVGLLSTMSSGPYMMLIVVTFCLWLQRHRFLVRPILIAGMTACLLVEVVSNRHFYDVVADVVAMDKGNAWYRSQLMRMAIQDLPNYWTVGYGFADPGWGMVIDERGTDGCNDYVAHAAAYGLPGLIAFVGILVTAMRTTVRAYARSPDPWLRSLAWALGSIMVGLILAFFTVSPFKIMITVFYILLGLQGSLTTFAMPRRVAVAPGRQRRARMRAAPVIAVPAPTHAWPLHRTQP